MTKKEIYEQVVRLTKELAQTKVAEKIFKAAKEGDALKTQMIIDAFPEYYPELNQKIVSFGKEFNKLVGDSEEDNAKFKEIREQCEFLMYGLAETKVIEQIATSAANAGELQNIILNFIQEYSDFSQELREFQEEFTKYRNEHKTGNEGAIFGKEVDEENGIFVFDTNVIDALSFYTLNIFGNIDEIYFFTDWEEDAEKFLNSMELVTNENFANFVCSNTLKDWVGKDEEYQTIGEILVVALADEFEDQEDEESEE